MTAPEHANRRTGDAWRLEPDRAEIEKFVDAIFRHASPGGFVAVRAFFQDNQKTFRISTTRLSGGLCFLVGVAEDDARRAAQNPRPVVFCPPLATFTNEDRAGEDDVAEGLAISVECDEHPIEARTTLESILGPATVVVKSGGIWTNGGAEPVDKLHLHWRLAAPARGKDQLADLKRARTIACHLVGADPTNNPVCHPIRWPGSWHRKAEPRLAEIAALDPDVEVDLDAALALLIAAADAAGVRTDDPPATPSEELQGDSTLVAAALAVIPNDDLDWKEWNRLGMAAWAATAGNEDGFAAFDAWSKKASKYVAESTRARWEHFFKSPPTKLGFGTLAYRAYEADTRWRDEFDRNAEAAVAAANRRADETAVDEAAVGDGRAVDATEDSAGGSNKNKAAKNDAAKSPAPAQNTTPVAGGAAPATEGAPLPKLVINGSDPPATAKELAALIAARGHFFFNGYVPVRVAVETDCLPRALEVTTAAVIVHAHEICRPIKYVKPAKQVKGKLVNWPLSRYIALLYLQGLEGNWGLRPFKGISTAPLLDGDGTIRGAKGYDAATGLWCHNVPDLEVPDMPTQDDATASLQRLRSFFRTFPFADGVRTKNDELGVEVIDQSKNPGLDESSFLAALLTAVCRNSLDLAPGFLCDAPALSGSGTGKGLLVKSACIIASGVKPSALTSGHDADEFNKRLTSALIEARPAVFLDNFNSKELRSDILASALTENPAIVRVLGQTKNVPLHTKTFIGITGNGVQVAEDMARRLLNARIDAKIENPEQRKFEPGFLDRVLAERPRLLSDALTVWRWGRRTRLKAGKALGSYEVWAQWCRDPLIALGGRDPVDRTNEIKEADPRRRELIAIFTAWWDKHKNTIVKASDLPAEVVRYIDPKATHGPDGKPIVGQRVRQFLAQHAGTRVGGFNLAKVGSEGPASRPVATYRLEKKEGPDQQEMNL